jgi:hypothetical protein
MRLLALPLIFVAGPALAQGASDSEPLRGNVLVWQDAAFYTDASEAAPMIHVATLAHRDIGKVIPMHVLSIKGAFVEVEPANIDCGQAQLATSDDIGKLRLFVKRADLAPVLSKPFAKTFPDGTKVALKAGLPVLPTTDGMATFAVNGNELTAEIPAAQIAHSYTFVTDRSAMNVSDRGFEVAPNTTVTLGERSASLGGAVASVERRGDKALLSIEDRCASVQVNAPTKSVRDADEDSTSIGGGNTTYGILGLREEAYLPVGTALSVESHQVATATKPIYLPATGLGKTVCVDRRVRIDGVPSTPAEDNKLRLCAPVSKIAKDKYRSARSAGR